MFGLKNKKKTDSEIQLKKKSTKHVKMSKQNYFNNSLNQFFAKCRHSEWALITAVLVILTSHFSNYFTFFFSSKF